ncbi:hypothetical protein [Streptomyces sp. SID2888]|uniref:hypothetical protein n=1 Tax=Streptomyces sp. SID2888 TaxID=2690256 RepID=UPI001370DDB3|nr:hypothetical protein [Streptomyces sp. SID2888]MYV45155.1 hypothetical protein [Streptomyces sp. SID2888]
MRAVSSASHASAAVPSRRFLWRERVFAWCLPAATTLLLAGTCGWLGFRFGAVTGAWAGVAAGILSSLALHVLVRRAAEGARADRRWHPVRRRQA